MHARRLLPAAALSLVLLVACSGDDGDDSASNTSAPTGSEAEAFVDAANRVCLEGKQRTAAIETGADVVPDPQTDAQREATGTWAEATASELDATADALGDIETSGDLEDLRDRAVDGYEEAADTLRDRGGAVLGDKNFLSDQDLFDAGLTVCFAPIKAETDTVTTTTEG